MNDEIVRITSQGQATIPARLRRRHGIAAPGLGRWVESGTRLVFEAVRSPRDMLGALAGKPGKEAPSAELLRERLADRAKESRKRL